jgi:hypothetical protein
VTGAQLRQAVRLSNVSPRRNSRHTRGGVTEFTIVSKVADAIAKGWVSASLESDDGSKYSREGNRRSTNCEAEQPNWTNATPNWLRIRTSSGCLDTLALADPSEARRRSSRRP